MKIKMDIKNSLRAALLNEGVPSRNKFGCVMVFLAYEKADWDKMLDEIEEEDLYDPEGETGFGKEDEPHVTILYGLHTDIPDADVKAEIDKIKSPAIELGKISSFPNEKYDVLKFDVVSEDLHELNKKFKKFPFTSDYPDYHPHCTIFYGKPNTASKYIKKLNDYIEKNGPLKVKPSKIVYSKADGTKKHFKLD